MKEEKKSKKKILLTYLILAVCLLVIAAITVTVVLTVNRNPVDNLIDAQEPDSSGDDDNKDNQGGNQEDDKNNSNDDNQDNKPTTSPTTLVIPIETAVITTRYDFGYDVTLDRYCVHQGMDFEGEAGTEVCVIADGRVTDIVTDNKIGENYITVTHSDGMTSTYKYVEVKEGLNVGDSVKRGEVIGAIAAASGIEMKQGDHLHFEIKVNGKTADPELYLEMLEK